VRREGHAGDPVHVAEVPGHQPAGLGAEPAPEVRRSRVWSLCGPADDVLAQLRAGLDVPDAQARVREEPAGEGLFAVGGEGHGPYLVLVPLEATDLLAGLDVPQPHRVVFAAGQQGLAVRRHGQAVDGILVSLQLLKLLAGLQVPDPDRAIVAA